MRRNNPTLKRVFAILIAAMLLLTSVSTVLADECEHEWSAGYVSQGNHTHAISCTKCGKPQHKPDPCSGFGENCWLCGASLKDEEPKPTATAKPTPKPCEHEWKGVSNNEDGTHNVVCRDCEKVLSVESHKFVDGAPCDCGAIYVEDKCEHEWKGVVNKDEATHTVVCRDCEEVLDVESHKYVNGVCACGAIYVEPECEHEWKGVVNKDEATHTIVCRDCEEVLGVESHKFVDGAPCACGKIYVEDECEHEWKGVVNKDEATHTIVCRDCEEVLGVESHKFVDGMPCACGKIYVEDHKCEFETVTSNEDGTHKINCECGEFVTVDCLDNDGDGKCDSCGYQKYTAECEHEWKGVSYKDEASHTIVCRDCLETIGVESHKYVDNRPCACGAIYVEDHKCEFETVTSNEDGTHKISCECGKFVSVNCLDNDGDGKCDSCGYQKYTTECEHEWKGVVLKDEASHYIVCRDCLKTIGVESHKFVNNMPCACGKIYIDHKCDFAAGVTTNNDGTHDVNCSCGVSVTVDCLDNNGDGKCDSCGYQKYCAHGFQSIKDNGDGTHTIVCRDCPAIIVENAAHEYNEWDVCACGAIKQPVVEPTDEPTTEPTVEPTDEPTTEPTVEPTEEPTVEPTDEPVDEPTDEPTEDTEDESDDETEEEADETEETDVPKTGDNRADMMMYVMAACVVMMGAALASAIAYFKPGKNRR